MRNFSGLGRDVTGEGGNIRLLMLAKGGSSPRHKSEATMANETYRIRCSEVWGGIRNIDVDVCTPGLGISIYSHAASGNSGGDIHYFSVCGKEMLTRIAVADLMGHGEGVSEISQWLYKALAARMNGLDGSNILSDLNQVVRNRGIDAMTTAAVVAFYLGDSNLYYSYAGHPPLLVRRRNKRSWRSLELEATERVANLPLGALSDVSYDQACVPLMPGDRLMLYTDGVVEARDSRDEPFGPERLQAVLDEAENCSLVEVKNAVLRAIRRHTGGSLCHDDTTLMVVEVTGGREDRP
jgi:sigma-B regulation protein RsbU (phosphoserine phosphatase)